MSRSLVFALGGTGGHLIPAQVVAQRLMESAGPINIQFVGHGVAKSRLIDHSMFDTYDVSSATLSLKHPFRSLIGLWKILKGIWSCCHFLRERRPALVVGFGSYHSFPVLIAALLCRIPIVLHESNVKPGRVNRVLSRFAKAIVVAYADTRRYIKAPILQLKMPLRYQLSERVDHQGESKASALEELNLDKSGKTLLIWGGSLGAGYLNKVGCEVVELLADRYPKLQVIHLCGRSSNTTYLKRHYAQLRVKAYVRAFEPKMDRLLAAADFTLCRSGAMTLAEVIEHEIPALMIPYPGAMDDHQDGNANYFVEQVAGGIKLTEELATVEKILSILCDWIERDGEALKGYREHIQEFKRSMPIKEFDEYLLEYL